MSKEQISRLLGLLLYVAITLAGIFGYDVMVATPRDAVQMAAISAACGR